MIHLKKKVLKINETIKMDSIYEKIWKFEYHNQLAIKFMICLLLSMILFYALIVFSVCILLSVWVDRSFCENQGRKKKQYSF